MTPGIQTLQREQARIWDDHLAALLERRDPDAAVARTTVDVVVLHLPVSLRAAGRDAVRAFYAERLVAHLPSDLRRTGISRTMDQFRLVQESVWAFRHDREMPWLVPELPGTDMDVRLLVIEIATFAQGRIAQRRLLWDHADLLGQLGRPAPSGGPSL